MRVLFDFHIGFFQSVDVSVNFLERLGAVRAVIFSTGHPGNLVQRLLIHVHGNLLIKLPAGIIVLVGPKPRLTARANADGIDFDSQRARRFGGGQRRDFARVVFAIRQQDHNFAF